MERTLTRHMQRLSPRYERLYRGESPYTSHAGALSTIRALVSWRGPLHVTCRGSLHDTSACIVERTLTRHMQGLSPRYERLYRGENPYTSHARALSTIRALVSWREPLHVTCKGSLHDTSACIVERALTRHMQGLSPRYERS